MYCMKTHSHIFGYLLGLVIFVIGIPALMVLVAENDWIHIQRDTLKWALLALLAIAGLALSIWSIVYMRRVGEGNPCLWGYTSTTSDGSCSL